MNLMLYNIIIILVVSQCCYENHAVQIDTRSKMFVRSEKESALVGHVIKTIHAKSALECMIQCNGELRCQSYNYKNTVDGLPVCQLNNETRESKPNDVISSQGFYYYGPIKSPCLKTNPCQNGGTCQPELNHPTRTHRCQCAAEYSGILCENLASDTASNFDITFPRRDIRDYVSLTKMPSLTSFTISLSVKLANDLDHTYISYATPGATNAIFFLQRSSRLHLWIMNKNLMFQDPSGSYVAPINADGSWHHLVLCWENTEGQTQLYVDGVLKHSKIGLQVSQTIPGNGIFVLGNDQDSYGGGFVSKDAFVGQISRVNVWSKVLPEATVKNLLRKCGNEVGTALAWRELRNQTAKYNGVASFQEPSTCS